MAESDEERSLAAQLEALGMAAAVLDEMGVVRVATAAFRSLSPALADGCIGKPLEDALKPASSDHTLCDGTYIYRIDRADGSRWYRDQRRTVSGHGVAVLLDVSLEWRLLSRQMDAAEALRREAHDNARRLRMTLAHTKAALYEGNFRFAAAWTSPELPDLAGPEAFSRFGDGTLDFFHPDDHETILVQRENDRAGRRILPAMVRLNRTDREFWVREFREIERDPNGEAPIPRLSYDPVRVNQCVSNLLSNAVKFTERGEVAMRLRVEPSGAG